MDVSHTVRLEEFPLIRIDYRTFYVTIKQFPLIKTDYMTLIRIVQIN